jgi:hypothetical protein
MPPQDPNLAQLPAAFRWWGPGPATDYIDMDHIIRELDDPIRKQVIAARFDAAAAVHRATAEGLAKIAGIIGGQRKG